MTKRRAQDDDLTREQYELETEAIEAGRERLRDRIDKLGASGKTIESAAVGGLSAAEALWSQWRDDYRKAIGRGEKRGGRPRICDKCLRAIDDADAVAIVGIHEALRACLKEPAGAMWTPIAERIGRAVCEVKAVAEVAGATPLKGTRVRIGDRLLRLLATTATTRSGKERIPAFQEANTEEKDEDGNYTTPRRLFLTPSARDVIEDGRLDEAFRHAEHFPMIVTPREWRPRTEGGYLRARVPLFNAKTVGTARRRSICDAVNAINAVPWRINRRMLDIVEKVWIGGGGVGKGKGKNKDKPVMPKSGDLEEEVVPEGLEYVPTEYARAQKAWRDLKRAGGWTDEDQERYGAAREEAGRRHPPPPRGDDKKAVKRWFKARERTAQKSFARTEEDAAKWKKRHDYDAVKDAFERYKKPCEIKAARQIVRNKLKVAEDFVKYERIYFPHQLDFRGRAYPVPQGLNHQQNDVSRALLEFAAAREVGERGRWWIKVHLANRCGQDKLPFGERVAWVEENVERFRRWVDDPLGNKADWGTMDDPFQAVAAAVALFDDEAAAHLPVQVDATCSAYQHIGALTKCRETGAFVNLVPLGVPGDFYGEVRKKLLARKDVQVFSVDCDGLTGCADLVEFGVDLPPVSIECFERKRLKNIVMTAAYGVERWRAKQVLREEIGEFVRNVHVIVDGAGNEALLVESGGGWDDFVHKERARGRYINFGNPEDYVPVYVAQAGKRYHRAECSLLREDKQEIMLSDAKRRGYARCGKCKPRRVRDWDVLWELSDKIVGAVFEEFERMTPAAKDALDWFKEAGKAVADADKVVRWKTPLGMEVVQRVPYTNEIEVERASRRSITVADVSAEFPSGTSKKKRDVRNAAKGKQSTGLAANFVHSLDASHMMLTASTCRAAGACFAAVHDCFWSHAQDMDRLGVILREEFIKLHKRPLLNELHERLQKLAGKQLPPPPLVGDLDLDEARDARYMFC